MGKLLHVLKTALLILGMLIILIGLWFYSKAGLMVKAPVNKDSLYLSSNDIKKSSIDVEEAAFDETCEIIALAGLDYRFNNNAQNSDAIILVQLDHENNKIRLISVYRDTYLKIINDYDLSVKRYAL